MSAVREDCQDQYLIIKKCLVACYISHQKFDWLKYIRKVFSNVSIDIHEEEPVVVYAPEYMKQVFKLTQTISNR